MSRLRQLARKPRVKKVRKPKVPFFEGSPYVKGIIAKLLTVSPKKPNSANRKVAKIQTRRGKKRFSFYTAIPGKGAHNLMEYSQILVRGAKVRDLPGVKTKAVRGVLDFEGIPNRVRSRSKYGRKKPERR
jgi:small subunit ribosomal protein S12